MFPRIHDVLRMQANELLMFIISTKDRLQDPNIPNSLPLAYALKGKNMSNLDLRHLINKVRDTLKERNIPLLVENYNGQWLNCMMLSESGEPLTKIRLANQIWGKFKKLGKRRLIEEITQMSRVYLGDLDLITFNGIPIGKSSFNSLCVNKFTNG